MTTPSFNLDTRRDILTAAVDLNEAGEVIPLLAFDAPDDLRAPARISLIAMGEARAGAGDFGWRDGAGLLEEIDMAPGGQAILAVRRDWLAERVALLRTLGGAEGLARVDIPFSTVLALPRAPRASPRRILRVTVAASAAKPIVRVSPARLDVDDLKPAARDVVAHVEIDVPTDIVFEPNRALTIDATLAGFPAAAVDVAPPPGSLQRITVREGPSPAAGAARRIVSIDDPTDLAGQVVRLAVALERSALIGAIDRLIAEGGGAPAPLRLAVRIAGWGDASAGVDQPDRRWVLQPPPTQIPVAHAGGGALLASIGDHTVAATLDPQGETSPTADIGAIAIAHDPDDAAEPVAFEGLKIALVRWPLGRSGTVEIRSWSRVGGETIAEPVVTLSPGIDAKSGLTRQAQSLLPFRRLVQRLSEQARARDMGETARDFRIGVALAFDDKPFLAAEGRVELRRRMHRMPICIDLGASAISVWAGRPHAPDASFEMRPLAIGSWLAANVDPDHEEAAALDGEAAILIPSHVSLDPLNHLRSDHAPQTLPDLAMLGPDRAAARARMAHFGRRYDVSVPAPPPIARSRSTTRRIAGLKRALATGQSSIALPDPVNRLEAADARVTQTSVIDVAPLAADVIDEIIDLYVMRLGDIASPADLLDPAPVAPRLVLTCPSGVGDEIRSRYGLVLDIVRRRMERLFPGASGFADAAEALPEAIAAARYAAELLKPQLAAARGPVIVVTLDLGGSTSDVALAEISAIAGRVETFRPLLTFGLPIGGSAIDAALTTVVCHHADAFAAAAGWTAAGGAASLMRAAASQEQAAIDAQRTLAAALQRAKAELVERLVRRAHDDETPYRWTEADEPMRVLLAEEKDGAWRGLLTPAGEPAAPAADDGSRIRLEGEAGARRLLLELDRADLEDERTPGVKRLRAATVALGRTLQRMARAAAPRGRARPRVMIVPTGRAALWPPLFELLAAEAAAARDEFPFARPLDPATMKKAVVAGAALLSSGVEHAERRPAFPCPLAVAVAGAHLTEERDGSLRTGSVAERVYYLTFGVEDGDRAFAAEDGENPSLAARVNLGQRFSFVRAAPGLDPMGATLSGLRDVLDHEDPILPLEGDAVVDARAERLDRFGVCELDSRADGPGRRKVTISARDRNWQAGWLIEGDRVSRLY